MPILIESCTPGYCGAQWPLLCLVWPGKHRATSDERVKPRGSSQNCIQYRWNRSEEAVGGLGRDHWIRLQRLPLPLPLLRPDPPLNPLSLCPVLPLPALSLPETLLYWWTETLPPVPRHQHPSTEQHQGLCVSPGAATWAPMLETLHVTFVLPSASIVSPRLACR